MRPCQVPLVLLCLGLAGACSSSGGLATPIAPGTLTLRLGADSIPGYSQVVVSVEKLEGSSNGSTWTTFGPVKSTYDLAALQNGNSALLLAPTLVAAGSYTQFRITWATHNYLDGSRTAAYAVPTGATVGMTLAMPITTVVAASVAVTSNGNSLGQVMINGDQAIQVRAGQVSPSFQATGRAQTLAATARITGHLGSGALSLSGVEVYAETVDGTGAASLVRRAMTDSAGNYVLEALPLGFLYFIVAQPAGTSTSYPAQAAAINITQPSTYSANLSFSGPQTPGSLALTVTPASAATMATWGELRQNLAAGASGTQYLIVRSQTLASAVLQDQGSFLGLAPGAYGVTAQRSTAGAAPIQSTGTTQQVNSGLVASQTLTF